jgi:hypothetical protein
MKELIKKIIMEAPLPDDWDHSTYTHGKSFASKLKYATDRASKVGTGSSRVAFLIEYQGRQTVLKIAKNKKGVAQNIEEIRTLEDYYLKELDLFIPMIDYDEKNDDNPQWIHTEYADKCKPSDFKKATGGTPADLVSYASREHGFRTRGYWGNADAIDPSLELVQSFVEYAGNYSPNLADYTRLANWGLYKGQPVILDAGFSDEVWKNHYS